MAENRKILITSTDLMMVQFLLPHVRNLSEKGWNITLACADVGGRMEEIRASLTGIPLNSIVLRRSPWHRENFRGYRQLRHLLKTGNFDILWTNEPVMGALSRLAARNTGTKVLYLCHGFHFSRGGPRKYWLFYPAEWILARRTDLLVTVNREDLALANRMKPGKSAYISGIGVDTARLYPGSGDLRAELGIPAACKCVLSVGELNENKDQASLLRAAARAGDPGIHVLLCGKGPREAYLKTLAEELGLSARVHFLGYRRDMGRVYAAADLLVHTARREGLGLAVLEGAFCGLPVIGWDIRGLRDYGNCLLPAGDLDALAEAIQNPPSPLSQGVLQPYLLETVKKEMERLLESL